MLGDETDDEPEVHCTPNCDDIRGICLIRLGELNAPSHCLLSPLVRPVLNDETDDEPEVHCTPNCDDMRGICLIRLGELNAPSHCLLACLLPCCVDGQAALGRWLA